MYRRDCKPVAIFNGASIEFTYDLDPKDCIVVVTDYPTEKCNPIIDWVTLGRLLNNKDLAEIVEVYPQIIREVL